MKTRKNKALTATFEVMIDGNPVAVKATLYETHTSEQRYRVSINGSPVYIFGWDHNRNRLAAIDSSNAVGIMPDRVESVIGQQLYTRMAA